MGAQEHERGAQALVEERIGERVAAFHGTPRLFLAETHAAQTLEHFVDLVSPNATRLSLRRSRGIR